MGGESYGLAIDIGTTTIVAVLVDLNTGKILGKGSGMNKQITYGEDLVTRTAIARNEKGLKKLQKVVVSAINEVISKIYEETGIVPSQVSETTVGANTVMNHLFAGLESGYLEIANVEVSRDPIIKKAGKIGLNVTPRGMSIVYPMLAGFLAETL